MQSSDIALLTYFSYHQILTIIKPDRITVFITTLSKRYHQARIITAELA